MPFKNGAASQIEEYTMPDSDRIKLAEMVEKMGMLRKDISKSLGIHQRTLYRYLSGELEIPVTVMLAMQLLTKGK
jgi:hypothetical protein